VPFKERNTILPPALAHWESLVDYTICTTTAQGTTSHLTTLEITSTAAQLSSTTKSRPAKFPRLRIPPESERANQAYQTTYAPLQRNNYLKTRETPTTGLHQSCRPHYLPKHPHFRASSSRSSKKTSRPPSSSLYHSSNAAKSKTHGHVLWQLPNCYSELSLVNAQEMHRLSSSASVTSVDGLWRPSPEKWLLATSSVAC
jgi:hypothetical protein